MLALLLLMSQNAIAAAIIAAPPIPPTTPPTIGPTFDLDPDEEFAASGVRVWADDDAKMDAEEEVEDPDDPDVAEGPAAAVDSGRSSSARA